MDYEWYDLCNSKFRYQTGFFSENGFGKRFNRLNHEHMLVSVASYGGTIAITSDKSKILTLREQDASIENICIFSNEGDFLHRIKLVDPFHNIIVCMEFIQDQYLLVIYQKGEEWLIDPHTGQIKKLTLLNLFEGELLAKVKIFQNGFAAFTSQKRFIFVKNAFQPQCVQFVSCEQELKEAKQNLFWTVFAPKQIISEKVELHIVHPTAGIIQIIQNEGKRIFFNHQKSSHIVESKLPNLAGIKYISNLSPNKKLIAYFAADPIYKEIPIPQKDNQPPKKQLTGFNYKLIIAPSINSDAMDASKFKIVAMPFVKENVYLNEDQQPLAIRWCGSKALIVQFQNQQLYMYSVDGDFIRIEKDRGEKQKWSFLKEEVDGTRVLSKNENKIIRQIPTAYINIFESFSEEPGALLYSAYEAFEDEAPLQDDQIRKDKEKLAKGVEQCIQASKFELKFEVATKLMKAATYGKAFLKPNMINNNLIYETSKFLRIVHHLRGKLRYITYEQLAGMSDDQLLKILLRNREHYLAFQIYNYLKKDQNFRVKIFTDWACCKVQNFDDNEDDICEQIRYKLRDEKGVSFTEIAHKSIEIGRSDLAMKLLEFEPSLSKKVPLLLWIGNRQSLENCHKFYQKGIEDALRSRDLNLLFLAIKRILASQKLTDFEIFQLFSKNIEGVFALINYYRMFDSAALFKYYNFLSDSESAIIEYLRLGLKEKKYQNMQKLLYIGGQQFKNYQSKLQNQWRPETFRKLFQHFCQFIKHNPNVKYINDKTKPVTLAKQLQFFVKKNDGDAVNDLKNEYKISDKRAIMTKIKTLIEEGKWQDLLTFVERHQKSHKIPVELLADILLQRKQPIWAMKMIARMPSKQKDEQYMLLQRIGRIKEAIDLAFDRKDIEVLEEIQATLIDQSLIAHLTEKLSILNKRK